MAKHLALLIIEDSEHEADLIVRSLVSGGFDVHTERVNTKEGMSAALGHGRWDVVISAFALASFSGPAAFALFREFGHDIPFSSSSELLAKTMLFNSLKAGGTTF